MLHKKYSKEDKEVLIASNLGNNDELQRKVMDKMKYQWKKIRKAFMNLNIEKSGAITKQDLTIYFSSWGLTKEQFDWLFDQFDKDKDGKISYNDFTTSIGAELYPQEGLYFR